MVEVETEIGTEFLHEEYTPFHSPTPGNALTGHSGYIDYDVDIIAVQGLASTYPRTWSIEDSQEPDGRYHWLRQKLPNDIPQARVLAFEYDSSWYKNPSHVDIEDCARWLLRCIVHDRRHKGERRLCRLNKRKPIIFVGHSFGGLVIKQALVLASRWRPSGHEALHIEYCNHRDILSAVAGIIFLGTPHRGTNFARLATWKMNLGRSFGVQVHEELLNLLNLNNPTLRSLHNQFEELQNHELPNLQTCCCFETHDVTIPPQTVVARSSACLDRAENIPMAANHMELNKFRKGKDKNYDLFLEVLQAMVAGSRCIVESKFAARQYNNTHASFDLQNLKRWLNPSDEQQAMYHTSRLREQRAAPFTCRWIGENQAYQGWNTSSKNEFTLWVCGAAGAGKSVLCSYLIDSIGTTFQENKAEKLARRPIVQGHSSQECEPRAGVCVLYFLHGIDREHESPWSFIGTLIHQLLASNIENVRLLKIAQQACTEHKTSPRASTADWNVLKSLLIALLSSQELVYIFIDGLEENRDLQDCLRLIGFLRALPNVRIAFFSQDVAEVFEPLTASFPDPILISIRDHTAGDVQKFASLKADELVQVRTELAPKALQIKEKLQNSADGIFQWVNESIRHLKSVAVYELDQSLKEMPVGLHSSYEKIFSRIARAEPAVQKKVQSALRWLAVSARPLTVRDLWTALRLEARGDRDVKALLEDCSSSSHTDEAIVDELYELLGPLLRISHSLSSGYYIQLIHPSLRVAVTVQDVGDNSAACAPYHFSESAAQVHCFQLCMDICAETALHHAVCLERSLPPLVDYAWSFWAYHCHRSGLLFDDAKLRTQFDKMVAGVSRDCLVFLNALVDFSSVSLVEMMQQLNELHSTMSVKLAQKSLSPAVDAMVLVRKNIPIAFQLSEARKYTDADRLLRPEAPSPLETDQQDEPSGWATALKSKFASRPSSTLKLALDLVLAQRPQLVEHRAKATSVLTRASQCLRIVALRFSVEPVATTLKLRSNARSLSPIHLLARVANFMEECGNYPYWDITPPNIVYTRCFACSNDDRFFGPAKFVLQALDDGQTKVVWTEDRVRLLEKQSSLPSQITSEHKRHVQKIYQMPGHSHLVAQVTYSLFNFNMDVYGGLTQILLVNPMKEAHLRTSLLVARVSGSYTGPDELLASQAPESYYANEYQEFVRAIPQLIKLLFVRYVVALFEVFADLTQAAIALHIVKLKACANDLDFVGNLVQYSRLPGGLISPAHFVPGLILFCIRCRYMPWWTIYITQTTWQDLYLGLKHPAAFLNIDGNLTFRATILLTMKCKMLELLGLVVTTRSLFSLAPSSSGAHIAKSILCFNAFLLIERIAFRVSRSLVTAVATGRVMFSDADSVGGVVSFTFSFWFIHAFALMLHAGHVGMLQGLNGWWQFFALLSRVLLLILFSVYLGSVGSAIRMMLYPITLPLWLISRAFFASWAWILRIIGASTFLLMVALAVFFARQYWMDPYGLKDSLEGLQRAAQAIRLSIGPDMMMSLQEIGRGKLRDSKGDQYTSHERAVLRGTGPAPSNTRHSQLRQDPEVIQETHLGRLAVGNSSSSDTHLKID